VKAGRISPEDFVAAEQGQSRSAGSCMSMGTASTMASMTEALGIGMPDNAAIPAVDARRQVLAHMAGRRIVELVNQDIRMSKILTRKAFENAIRVNGAIGGSTNAVIHLIAIAGRLGVKLSLDDWDRLGRDIPTIVDLMPSGRFLMEEFYYAGGLPAVLRRLGENGLLPHPGALTVNGQSYSKPVEVIRDPSERGEENVKACRGNGSGSVRRHSPPEPKFPERCQAEKATEEQGICDAADLTKKLTRDDVPTESREFSPHGERDQLEARNPTDEEPRRADTDDTGSSPRQTTPIHAATRRLVLQGACARCPAREMTRRLVLEPALRARVPGVTAVILG
jgi:hypothetical protein